MRRFHLSLQQKIVLLYVLLGIIPVILAGSLSYFTYSQDIQRNAEITLDYMQKQCADDIHLRLRRYKNAMAGMLTDEQVIAAAAQLDRRSDDPEADQTRLRNRLLSHASSSSGAISVTYISNSLDYATCSFADMSIDNAQWRDAAFRERFLLPPNENYSIDHYILQRAQSVTPQNPLGDTLYLSFPFSDRATKKPYGVLVMELPNSIFLEGMVADLWGGVENLMADRDGTILLSLQPELLGKNIADLPYADARLYFSRDRGIRNSRFVFHSFVSREAVTNQVLQFRSWMSLLIVILCATFFTAMFVIMRRYTRTVRGIAKAIQLYGQGVHEIDIPIQSKDEVSVIAEQFNYMARENNALLQNLQDQNRHIARMTDLRRRAEIKALQAQINPHFLYNTLDSINWIAIDNGQGEISGMIKALGSLLRYSISNIDQLVLLEAELQWCKKYVYLQQKRFDTLFDFHAEADGRARAFPIHKMLLQPLLENCIVHGFEETRQREDKRIRLRCALLEDGRLQIHLQDNGSGMSAEALEKVRGEIAATPLQEQSGIGISNVVSRMRLYYGDRGEMRVDSAPGLGTDIRLVIPAEDTELQGGSES